MRSAVVAFALVLVALTLLYILEPPSVVTPHRSEEIAPCPNLTLTPCPSTPRR